MANLSRRKVNFTRSNRYRPVLEDVEIMTSRDNLTGHVSITINSNAEEGEERFQLTLSQDELYELAWLFKPQDRQKGEL